MFDHALEDGKQVGFLAVVVVARVFFFEEDFAPAIFADQVHKAVSGKFGEQVQDDLDLAIS